MNNSVTALGAFLAGLLSFLSPCVLPLVPAYLSFLAGVNLEALKAGGSAEIRWRSLRSALGFVLGFSFIFIALGASATFIGHWLLSHSVALARVSGILLMVLGLHVSGLVTIPWLMREKRFQPSQRPLSFLGAFVVGMAFAFGWTPCVGPILAGILALASTRETIFQGILLLGIYSAGLGLPFLLGRGHGRAFFKMAGPLAGLFPLGGDRGRGFADGHWFAFSDRHAAAFRGLVRIFARFCAVNRTTESREETRL